MVLALSFIDSINGLMVTAVGRLSGNEAVKLNKSIKKEELKGNNYDQEIR